MGAAPLSWGHRSAEGLWFGEPTTSVRIRLAPPLDLMRSRGVVVQRQDVAVATRKCGSDSHQLHQPPAKLRKSSTGPTFRGPQVRVLPRAPSASPGGPGHRPPKAIASRSTRERGATPRVTDHRRVFYTCRTRFDSATGFPLDTHRCRPVDGHRPTKPTTQVRFLPAVPTPRAGEPRPRFLLHCGEPEWLAGLITRLEWVRLPPPRFRRQLTRW